MSATRRLTHGLLAVLLLALARPSNAEEGWKVPPAEVVRILEAKATPLGILDPSRTTLLLVERVALPPLADLAAPMIPLGGVRVNPRTMGQHGVRRYAGLVLLRIADGRETRVALPIDADIAAPAFSPDGERFAFTRTRPDGIELWVGETESGKARPLTGPTVHAALGTVFRWLPDSRSLLVKLVPEDRSVAPDRPLVPPGPDVQETAGKKAPARTFTDLLRDAHDEALFEHTMRARLARVRVEDAATRVVIDVEPGSAIHDFEPSPDGRRVLVRLIHRPYSRLVPVDSFAEDVVVQDLPVDGVPATLERRLIASLPVREEIPIQGVEACPRSFDWCDTEPATLTWLEALDGGDPRRKVPHRDRVLRLALKEEPSAGRPPRQGPGESSARDRPLVEQGRELLRTEHRCTNLSWLETPGRLLVGEYDRDRRWTRTWLYDASAITGAAGADAKPLAPVRLLFDRSAQDRYGAPGAPLMTRSAAGRAVVRVREGSIFLAGPGASLEGDRPFLDRMRLSDGATTRLYRSPGKEHLDTILDVLDADASRLLVTRESPSSPPNYVVLERTAAPAGGAAATGSGAGPGSGGAPGDRAVRGEGTADYASTRAPLTAFSDPAAEVRRWPPRLLTYARPDGVTLSARLYIPPSWKPGGPPVPLLVWAYPLEYNDPRTAGQVAGSPWSFAPLAGLSPLLLLTQGYAVLDGAAMPVIGDPETVNDTFVEQIAASARVAIAVAVREGVADPERCAIAGHSYGAFMTANLLAHTDLFRAGVARSGAYNRTLTPFGFQGERRSYWEATETYIRMSPFTVANRIDEPLLMIHGRLDQNTGTFPIQSERLFHAIQGNGGTARLVMLPFENHGYAARESVLDVQAETIEWLDRYVKNAPPRKGVER